MAKPFTCLACGYPGLDEPAWIGKSGSDQICPCCGLHFGYDDAVGGRADLRPAFYHGWRLKWRLDGMTWWSTTPPPADWDPASQLEAVHRTVPSRDAQGPPVDSPAMDTDPTVGPEGLRRLTFRVSNPGDAAVLVRLEPWGREHDLPPGGTRQFVFDGPDPVELEVEVRHEFTIHGWTGSVVDD